MRRVVFRIGRDNALAVSAPLSATDAQITAFVGGHIAAFAAKQRLHAANARLDLARRIVALDGTAYALKPVRCTSVRTERLEFLGDACYAHVSVLTEARVALVVKREYVRLAEERLPQVVDRWAGQTGIRCDGLTVRWVVGKWGHWQTRERRMLLAAQLIAYPPQVVDYVVVHELAHAVHPDHSRAFWQTVREWYGDYALARRQLKDEEI